MWLCKISLLVLNCLKKLNTWTFFLLFVIAISQCGCFLQPKVNIQYDPTVNIIFLTYNMHAILKHMWESWSYSGFGTSIELGNHWCRFMSFIELCKENYNGESHQRNYLLYSPTSYWKTSMEKYAFSSWKFALIFLYLSFPRLYSAGLVLFFHACLYTRLKISFPRHW